MASPRRFRALSLDLWFTAFYHTAEDAVAWERARTEVLRRYLVGPGARPLEDAAIDAAARAVRAGLQVNAHAAVTTDPSKVVADVAARLGSTVRGRAGEAARDLSAAGFDRAAPRTNPEAEVLVQRLARRGIPTVLVTNSARRASTWSEFLRARGGPPFQHVVSSCDLGVAKPDPAIFREAARALGVMPSELLHVGDRWELDVVGALAAGCEAALYRGLWERYPPGLYDDLPAPPSDTGTVPVLDHLDALGDPSLWAQGGDHRQRRTGR